MAVTIYISLWLLTIFSLFIQENAMFRKKSPAEEKGYISCPDTSGFQNNRFFENRLSKATDSSVAPLEKMCGVKTVNALEKLTVSQNVKAACESPGAGLPDHVLVGNCETKMTGHDNVCVHYAIFLYCRENGFEVVDQRGNRRFTASFIQFDNCDSSIECGENYGFLTGLKSGLFQRIAVVGLWFGSCFGLLIKCCTLRG